MALHSTIVRAPAGFRPPVGCASYPIAPGPKRQANSFASPITFGHAPLAFDAQETRRAILRWQRGYRLRKVLCAVLALLTWPARLAFGCRHLHPTRPLSNHQTCLDCGSSRRYEYTRDGISIGQWRSAVRG